MSLDQRLHQAREDYLAAVPDEGSHRPRPLVVPVDARRHGHRPGRRPAIGVAAAVVVLAGLVGGVVLVARGGDDDLTRTEPGTTVTEPSPTTTMPGAVVLLDDEGPYVDGQEVVVRVPAAIDADLAEPGGVGQCVSVVTVVGDRESSSGTCAPSDDLVVPGTATTTSATVRLRRTVTTAMGTFDCAAEGVECRLEVRVGGPTSRYRRRSPVLVFAPDPPPAEPATLEVEPTGEPGTFTLRPTGLAPDPSWLALRADHPDRTEGPDGYAAFVVLQCAESTSLGGTPPPFAGVDDPWDQGRAGYDQTDCGTYPTGITLDPDDPNAPLTVTLPRIIHGFAWADCRVDRCYLEVQRSSVGEVEAGGPLHGSSAVVATGHLPTDGTDATAWPDARRPTLTVDTPGPHLPGQSVDVTIAGLPVGVTANVGLCRLGQPWGCGVPDEGFELGNGRHRIPLLEGALRGCGPEECYLALDEASEAIPPLATAPLDTPE